MLKSITKVLSIGLTTTVVCLASSQATAAIAWWEMSDAEFANTFADDAFSPDVKKQSRVAWMLFARVNKRMEHKGKEYSQWELWPSNKDTFDKAGKMKPSQKLRTTLHFQAPKKNSLAEQINPNPELGEEITRNWDSYTYIKDQQLDTISGIKQFLKKGKAADFPIGAIEVKAVWNNVWSTTNATGYQVTADDGTTYTLRGFHIMMKMKQSPSDIFSSKDPSWFWTTFEFKENKGLENAIGLVTYKQDITEQERDNLLKQSGLANTNFNNYVSVGTQYTFSTPSGEPIILGNTTMESFAGVCNLNTDHRKPDHCKQNPQKWVAWDSSCHSCHGATSAKLEGDKVVFYPIRSYIGDIMLYKPDLSSYISFDFVWAIPFQVHREK